MNKKSRRYEVNGTRVRTWNPFVGCKFNCSYCYAPEIYKHFSKCEQCKAFTPHFHPERLQQKFKAGETVFVCSMGDISFASFDEVATILKVIINHPLTTFLIQSKAPARFAEFIEHWGCMWHNVVLGATIETNRDTTTISKAPDPVLRYCSIQCIIHRKYVTIEPILDFDLSRFAYWIKQIAPEFVYVGYLNPLWKAKKLQLPEPPLQKTRKLIEELGKFTEVRLKTIRMAWNEER